MKMQFINGGRRSIMLVADTEQEELFIIKLVESFREGCVTIEGKNHKANSQCIECLSSQRYKDCVTASATYGMDSNIIQVGR